MVEPNKCYKFQFTANEYKFVENTELSVSDFSIDVAMTAKNSDRIDFTDSSPRNNYGIRQASCCVDTEFGTEKNQKL